MGKPSRFPNLSAEMKRLSITEEDLSKVADCAPRTVYKWLKLDGEPRVSAAMSIRDKFFPGYPLEYLYSREPIELGDAGMQTMISKAM